MKRLRGSAVLWTTALLAAALTTAPLCAGVIEEIFFEAGSISAAGSGPDASGWKFDPGNVLDDIPLGDGLPISGVIVATAGRPTFTNGTNQEAYVMRVYGDATAGTRERQGIVWELAQDAGAAATAETFDAGEVLYTVVEQFSDVARANSNARYKTQIFFGQLDDGSGTAGDSGVGGFNGAATPFDPETGGFEASWQWSQETVDFGIPAEAGAPDPGSTAMQHNDTRFEIAMPPTPAELALNHTSIALFRHGSDSAEGFIGTELEVSDTQGTFNGGHADNALNDAWGGNTNVVEGAVIDKVTAYFSRQRTVSQFPDDVHSTFVDLDGDGMDVQMGIKYFKIGTTTFDDVNLDAIVDAADKTIVQVNQGIMAGATMFDGDVDNDQDVDADDLAFYDSIGGVPGDFNGDDDVDGSDLLLIQRSFGAASDVADFDDWEANYGTGVPAATATGAVPEPTAPLLIVSGAMCLSAGRRRNR